MKKLFLILVLLGFTTLFAIQAGYPQETTETLHANIANEGEGLHQALKTNSIEGSAYHRSLSATARITVFFTCR